MYDFHAPLRHALPLFLRVSLARSDLSFAHTIFWITFKPLLRKLE